MPEYNPTTIYHIAHSIGQNTMNQYAELLCPVCEGEYNKVSSIITIHGLDDYLAGWEGRGDLTVTKMKCEGGHEWELCIGFHKGILHIFTRTQMD